MPQKKFKHNEQSNSLKQENCSALPFNHMSHLYLSFNQLPLFKIYAEICRSSSKVGGWHQQ